MRFMEYNALMLAQRFIGIHEVKGNDFNTLILAWLRLVDKSVTQDEVAWCSAFAHYVAYCLDIPRSKSLGARTWLNVGEEIALEDIKAGFDILIFKRGDGNQPGPEIIAAPGHVAFYENFEGDEKVRVTGGNQSDAVTSALFLKTNILGARRLY